MPELEPARKSKSLQARGLTYGPILHIPSDLLKCPGDQPGTNSTASEAICQFCTTTPVSSRSFGKRAGPSCIRRDPGNPDEPSCRIPGGPSKRSNVKAFFADLVKPALYGRDLLEKRDRKKITWATTIQGLGPSPLELDAGAYPPCSQAVPLPGIPKYYTFDPPNVGCSGVIKQQSAATVNSLNPVPAFESKQIISTRTLLFEVSS